MSLLSSVLIAAERDKLDLEAMLQTGGSDRFVVAAITASEILHGVHRAAELAAHGINVGAHEAEGLVSLADLLRFIRLRASSFGSVAPT